MASERRYIFWHIPPHRGGCFLPDYSSTKKQFLACGGQASGGNIYKTILEVSGNIMALGCDSRLSFEGHSMTGLSDVNIILSLVIPI